MAGPPFHFGQRRYMRLRRPGWNPALHGSRFLLNLALRSGRDRSDRDRSGRAAAHLVPSFSAQAENPSTRNTNLNPGSSACAEDDDVERGKVPLSYCLMPNGCGRGVLLVDGGRIGMVKVG